MSEIRCNYKPLRCLLLPLVALVSMSVACGDDSPPGDDDDNDQATATPAESFTIQFLDLAEGDTVTQKVSIEIEAPGATSMRFLAPPELMGVDQASDADRLEALWDTTRDLNGSATIEVEATGPGGTIVEELHVTRYNIPANIQGAFASTVQSGVPTILENDDYVRFGTPLNLSFTASAFGSTPTLNRMEIRSVSGCGLAPQLPQVGVASGTWFNFPYIGTPLESGTVDILVNAVNASGEYSEPLLLRLVVLQNDIVNSFMPLDFEVAYDGVTGLLLASESTGYLYLVFIDLSIPSKPKQVFQMGLDSGVAATSANLFVHPAENKVYVLFPNATKAYAIDVTTRSVLAEATIYTPLSPLTGVGLGRLNRMPYGQISADGQYIFAVSTSNALVVLETSTMAQLGPDGSSQKGFTMPQGGFALMAVRPQRDYVYLVNNWGDTQSGTGDVAVFEMGSKSFLDFNPQLPENQAMTVERPPNSQYLIAQQPVITPDGSFLVVPWLERNEGRTKITTLSLSSPKAPTKVSELNLYDARQQTYGTAVSISNNGQYVLVADRDANLNSGVVVDLLMNRVLTDVVFGNYGSSDGVFSNDSTRLFVLPSSWSKRDMSSVELATSRVSTMAIPGNTNLAPPSTVDDIRNTLIARSGNYFYVVIPARVADTSGVLVNKGTSLSVYDITTSEFIFPNP